MSAVSMTMKLREDSDVVAVTLRNQQLVRSQVINGGQFARLKWIQSWNDTSQDQLQTLFAEVGYENYGVNVRFRDSAAAEIAVTINHAGQCMFTAQTVNT